MIFASLTFSFNLEHRYTIFVVSNHLRRQSDLEIFLYNLLLSMAFHFINIIALKP
jgi:hypothetical protein